LSFGEIGQLACFAQTPKKIATLGGSRVARKVFLPIMLDQLPEPIAQNQIPRRKSTEQMATGLRWSLLACSHAVASMFPSVTGRFGALSLSIAVVTSTTFLH